MNNLGHLFMCFPSPQHHHTRLHTSFSKPTLTCCQIPKTPLITLTIWGDGLRITVHWERSYCNHTPEILNRPSQLEAPPHFSSSPRGIVAREQRVTLQQEMLILDLSAKHVFLINSQTKMNHHLCSWGNRGERDPKLQLGICLPEL